MITVPKLSDAQKLYWLLKEKLPYWPKDRGISGVLREFGFWPKKNGD